MDMSENERCPACGSQNAIPILHGLPNDEAFVMPVRGHLKLGSFCITGNDPQLHCQVCGTDVFYYGGQAKTASKRPKP